MELFKNLKKLKNSRKFKLLAKNCSIDYNSIILVPLSYAIWAADADVAWLATFNPREWAAFTTACISELFNWGFFKRNKQKDLS